MPPSLPVVGISGNYCAGKSTIAAVFALEGWVHIDVDALGHNALIQQQKQLIEVFPSLILDQHTGIIDRKKLGQLVFSDPKKLALLESLVHPLMVQQVKKTIAFYQNTQDQQSSVRGIFIDAAILYKLKLETVCSLVLWIQAPLLLRLIRAKQRDNTTLKNIFRRLLAQRPSSSQLKNSSVDKYRVNNWRIGDAIRRINRIFRDRYGTK